jgi:thioredoxin-like negative regulator of GroEL
MDHDQRRVLIRAFVGRSFLEQDEPLWVQLRKVLESLRPFGFEFEDASEPQPRPISKKVKEGIERNDVYIGVLTQRFPIYASSHPQERLLPSATPDKWGTSAWIVQESGYALGKNKRVILLLEEGVDFLKSDLDADQERILFNRSQILLQCSGPLTSMIGNLVSERISAVVPSGETQVAPPDIALSREQQTADEQQTTLGDVFTLLDENKVEQADLVFQDILSRAKDDWRKIVLRAFYLGKRAVNGHSASVEELQMLSRNHPNATLVWYELAEYYAHFHKYSKAADILISGAEKVNGTSRPWLIARAAKYLAQDQNYASAYDLLRKSMADNTSVETAKVLYLAIADVAKQQREWIVESGALERALETDPTDSDIRFRIAFLYAERNRPHLAVYHYSIRLGQMADSATANNLALEFGSLRLTGKEIELLREASERNPLAKANLAGAYLERGFLQNAEELAKSAVKEGDEHAQVRATSILALLSEQRKREEELHESITAQAEEERRFRVRYGEAFVGREARPLAGFFELSLGSLEIQQDGTLVVGRYEHSEEVPLASFASLLNERGVQTAKKTMTLQFSAILPQGRAGHFRFERRERSDSIASLLGATSPDYEAKGLMIVAEDSESFELLNENENPCQRLTAKKVAAQRAIDFKK